MRRALVLGPVLALCLGLAAPVAEAQDQAQTLADIRQELSVLFVEIQRLRGELNTTGVVQGLGGGANLAVAEQGDYDRARAAYEAGDYTQAAQLFEAFTLTYPGGPLSAEAHFLRGQSEGQLGQWSRAARAYLDSFTANPEGPRAPSALVNLGTSLGQLGQTDEACLTLGEVGLRYPGDPAVSEAEAARLRLGCS